MRAWVVMFSLAFALTARSERYMHFDLETDTTAKPTGVPADDEQQPPPPSADPPQGEARPRDSWRNEWHQSKRLSCKDCSRHWLPKEASPPGSPLEQAGEYTVVETDWPATMEYEHGPHWDKGSVTRKVLDAVRCWQWTQGLIVVKDKDMLDMGMGSGDVGSWSCMSAMIREAASSVIHEKRMGKHVTKVTSSSVLEQEANATARIDFEIITWAPEVCQFATKGKVKIKDNCKVTVYDPAGFRELMKQDAQPNMFADVASELSASIDSGPVVAFKPGAGKSGSTFARTFDDKFKIKMGLRRSKVMNEPQNLMQLLKGSTKTRRSPTRRSPGPEPPSLREHFVKYPTSFLNRVYAIMSVRFDEVNSFVLIMGDAAYGLEKKLSAAKHSAAEGFQFVRYDLKGASRPPDRQKPDDSLTLINGNFAEREGGLALEEPQCKSFQTAVLADVRFLHTHNLIDYSLFLVVATPPVGQPPLGCGGTPLEPFCFESARTNKTYTVSMIDYLNNKNWAKDVESMWFGGKFANYDQKIFSYTKHICPALQPTVPEGDTSVHASGQSF